MDQSERCSSLGSFTSKWRSARLASPTEGYPNSCALIIVSKRFANWNEQSRFNTNRSYSAAWKTLRVSGDANTGASSARSEAPLRASGSIR